MFSARIFQRWLSGALVLGLWAGDASAQPWSGDPKNTATAQSLFDEARRMMQAEDFVHACPKLEEVVRLEPSGVGAKVKLGECYERLGRLTSAFATYVVAETAARAAGQPDRELWARDRAAALRPRLSTVTLVVGELTGDLQGFVLRRDGVSVGRAQWGAPIPVDGGSVEIVAEAPGKTPFRRTLDIKPEGDAQTLAIPPFDEAATVPVEPPPAPLATKPPAPPPAPRASRDVPEAPIASHVPTWAWVTGALGLASGLVGVGFRIDGAVVESDQADVCGPDRDACPRTYDVDETNARKERDFALFVGFGATGVAALGAGIIGAVVGLTDEPTATTAWNVGPWAQLDARELRMGVRGHF